jgi:hypothetical protein
LTVVDYPTLEDIQKELEDLSNSANGQVELVADIPTVGLAAAAGAPADGRPGVAPGEDVRDTLRDILGWTWKPGDTQGFLAALRASYTLEEVAGGRRWEYTPTGTAIRADLGAVSGAQAVLLQQVKTAADRIIPEVETIPPLAIAPDPQQVAALRTLVAGNIRDLAEGFAKVDGPIVQLIDNLWRALLGPLDSIPNDPEHPSALGHVGQMQDVFDFDRARVNSVEQELTLSRWLSIVTELTSLYRNYDFQKGYLTGTAKPPYLGTRFVVVSQALEVMGDSVREFRAALVGHFIEDAEQERIVLELEDGSTILLGALLTWAEGFPAEAQSVLKQAGKEGAKSLIAPLVELSRAAKAARPDNAKTKQVTPYLYTHSPLIRSTQNVFEQSILRTLALLIDFRDDLGYPPLPGGDPWYIPGLGETPIADWRMFHTPESTVVVEVDTRARGDVTVSLVVPEIDDPFASATATKVAGDLRRAEIDTSTVPSGQYLVVVTIAGRQHPVGTIRITKP